MNEQFLHYIWKFRYFNHQQLQTTGGLAVQVIHPGIHNQDAGPDFFNARIRIGPTEWAGNVEIHQRSSDWTRHRHHLDRAYDNVILHVVLNHDAKLLVDDREVPTLELCQRIDPALVRKYRSMMNSKKQQPCAKQLPGISSLVLVNWQSRLLVERLHRKSARITERLVVNKNDWEETCYQIMAGNFGFKVNNQPFEMLATALPLKYLAKHKNNILQLEALLFGQAGFLTKDFRDEYPRLLKHEYDFLSRKFNLQSMEFHLWKFFRLRPTNFPSIRIAQFAALVQNSSHLFSKILEYENIDQLYCLFRVKASAYWNDHFLFDQQAGKTDKKIGAASIHNILINTVIPILYAYGNKMFMQEYKERAISLLEKITAEKNTIIRKWQHLGVDIQSAFQSQAMLELSNNYCSRKKCLNCAIGNKILKE